ncbi:MAG TPA: DEAD/DEAH box helicase [Candidatus Limnocylindrales bacterium]|nr:DEAD/DEAH box helicase [Candidatus Limnocylindrales bacterium]
MSFEQMGLSRPLMKAIFKMGFESPTAIQEEVVPPAMLGQDIIGQAQTGTGKTAAFGIPLVEKIGVEATDIKGLVLTPTRELAIQVAEELNTIGQYKGIKALPVYGGQDINRQIRSLKNKPQIIVGTPGRLMDHMRRKTIRLQQVSLVVLDEADEMLDMGFIEDIELILKEVPLERQTMLFSATISHSVQSLARRFMQNPTLIQIKPKEVTVTNIKLQYVEVQERDKFDVLCRVLDVQSPERAIIFGRTKKRVDEINEALDKRGYSAEAIHGDLTQSKRDSVMRNFKQGSTELLVATDVAARGLDIGGVTHVYNFDIPQDTDSYVHRIGRTGRIGKTGTAVTLATPRERYQLSLIESNIKRKIHLFPTPTLSEVVEERQRITRDLVLGTLENEDTSFFTSMAKSMLEENDAVALMSAALKLLTREPDTTPVRLTEEAPPPRQRKKKTFRTPPKSPQSSQWKRK